MALQIRRGLEAGRAAVTPAPGELLFTTDQTKLYIGDGATAGGTLVTGSGIGNLVEDTTPQLGGNLDTNGHQIFSTGTSNITITPATGQLLTLHGSIVVGNPNGSFDGNLTITRDTYSVNPLAGFLFSQSHATPDAVNWTLYRTRGTNVAPAAVVTGDELGEIAFVGHDGTNPINGAVITVSVDGAVTTNRIPTKIAFNTNSTVSNGIRAEISSTGLKVNAIQNLSGSSLTLTATTVNVAGNVQIDAQGDLRFADANSSNWVAFQAPATVAANVTWTLPGVDGSSGQVLSTNGSGTLSWATASGGSGLSSRTALTPVTTASLASGASENLIITGYKGYDLFKIETSAAACVRLYSSTDARTADASRLEGTDPLPGAGVIAEIISTGAQTILITPGVFGFSTELTPNTQIPCTITNKSGITTTITVTLTILQLEV